MRFSEVIVGESMVLAGEDGLAWRRILRKSADGFAFDDHGNRVAVEPEIEVEVIHTVRLSHAMWVQHEGEWKLVLRWSNPREEEPQWASFDADRPVIQEFDRATGDRRARALLASGLHSRGEVEQALQIYDELIEDQEDASLLNNRGAARAAKGDVEGAIRDYSQALALDGNLAQAYSNRGNALTKLGRYEEAIADYDQAIDLAGEMAPIYCNRGLTRKMLGDLQGSMGDFEIAIGIDARFAPGYLARGGVRALLGDVKGAIKDLEQFLVFAPEAPQSEQVRVALQRLCRTLGKVH